MKAINPKHIISAHYQKESIADEDLPMGVSHGNQAFLIIGWDEQYARSETIPVRDEEHFKEIFSGLGFLISE